MKRKIVGFSEAGNPIYSDEVVESYLNLGKAIIRKANKDYLSVYGRMLRAKTDSDLRKLQSDKDELEEFYFSDWFATLTDIDPYRLVMFLRKKALRNEKARLVKKQKRDSDL